LKILINADDFGLTKGVTDGIIKAHTDGIVQSTTLMMNGNATDYAVTQAKKHPSLKVGIHLVLTWGKPMNKHVTELTDRDGFFKFNPDSQLLATDIEAIKIEWQTQLEAFLSVGLPLHHIDSHHHVHGWEPLKPVMIQLAKKYNVPVRFTKSLRSEPDILLTEDIWLDFYGDGVNEDLFSKLKHLSANSVEVMTHPGFVDDGLRKISSYTDKRKEELNLLCSLKMPNWVKSLNS
jgi:chitin disaccharide deacetylase